MSNENERSPMGWAIEELANLPEEKNVLKRRMWELWSRRPLLPMVLPKEPPTNTPLAKLRKEL